MKANKEMMEKAIQVAKASAQEGNYAIGAVVERDGEIVAVGNTLLHTRHDPTAHAETEAIRAACEKLEGVSLEGCVLYTTHEPCPMCASAAVWAKMKGIVFGATIEDARKNATDRFSWRQIDIRCKAVLLAGVPMLELTEEFMRDECNKLFHLGLEIN